jgi:hypothetical protein
MTRAASWTNSDGLVVGFGRNTPQLTGEQVKNTGTGVKVAATTFDWQDLNAARTINVPVPAGSKVLDVKIRVLTGFTSTGSNTITVGDGSDADGFITATEATTANMATAGAEIYSAGVYAYGATDTGSSELKLYTAADTIDLASAMTDWTAGKASLIVSYL